MKMYSNVFTYNHSKAWRCRGRGVQAHELDDPVPRGRVVWCDVGAALDGAGEGGRRRHDDEEKSVIWKKIGRLFTTSLRTSKGSRIVFRGREN